MSTTSSRLMHRISRWLVSVTSFFDPVNKEDLMEVLRRANDAAVMDRDSYDTMQRVLQVADLRVRDVMIPRSAMVVLARDNTVAEYLPAVTESAHSRFPVIDDDRDDVVGILLAKDLLRYFKGDDAKASNLRDILRPPVFIPESKRLNVLLSEFRANRNHMAIVVDEYGGTAGLITIEDVLEQIVGNIQDEHDDDEEDVNIIAHGVNDFSVKPLCPVDAFNVHFSTSFDAEKYETIAGVVINLFGRLPRQDEVVEKDGLTFKVLNADSRKILLLGVTRENSASEQ